MGDLSDDDEAPQKCGLRTVAVIGTYLVINENVTNTEVSDNILLHVVFS